MGGGDTTHGGLPRLTSPPTGDNFKCTQLNPDQKMLRNFIYSSLILLSCNSQNEKNSTITSDAANNESEQIERLEVISSGGMQGSYSSSILTKDSVYVTFSLAMDSLKNYSYQKENNETGWQSLINEIDIQDFKKAVNGESRLAFDGIDTKITIKTNKEEISRMNANTNKTWKTILDSTAKYFKH